ncbi:N-acetylmuramoyl-L-alanine amidase [uncultured Tateyamaria sp.]|uniref:N-acetylmuramoyl-L-alanine amidase n=1 Tax=uncultured Tateyamaria sp. TaxID=455651 RepID=UPI002618CF11|nr:N-acetylmuramoyl-L-alanine amidase [uncultured Tateyamaria sp.]
MTPHQHPSPNCGLRRDGLIPRFVVLHYTSMATAAAAIDRLCDPQAEVSAHYVICKTGRVTQLVPEGLRAWHAGRGQWQGLDDINSRSIGIELDNDGQGPFTEPLMQSLEALLQGLLQAWSIPPNNVIGHSDMAPGRKFDPGPWFDWTRLEAQGLAGPRSQNAGPDTPNLDSFAAMARAAGYTADVDAETLLAATRLRYRSFATGPLEPADYAPLGQHDDQGR